MSITDELRQYLSGPSRSGISYTCVYAIAAIADRIDAEHERLMRERRGCIHYDQERHYCNVHDLTTEDYKRGYDDGFASADDWLAQHEDAMAEHGWIRLPKDADGEVIHVGDELRDAWNEQNQGEVEWLMLDHHGWWLRLKTSCERFYVHEFHEWRHSHHHAPTVEDVLREFAHVGIRIAAKHGIKAGEIDFYADEDAIAEYAAKLRLAGDE